jgi:spermidine/putrescine transport system permease protein
MTRAARDETRAWRGLRLGPLAIPDWLLFVGLAVVPIGFMLLRSLGEVDPITLDVEVTGSLDSYRRLFSDLYRPVFIRSFTLSLATMVLCLVIGVPAALAASRLSPTWRTVALVAVMLPSFVNFTVRIFAWRGVLSTGGPLESVTGWQWLFRPPAVLIGMTTAYVPVFFLPAFVALSRVSPSLLDAAADLGARSLRQTWTVTLPLARSGIVAGVSLVGVLSVGEFVIPTLLGGGKVLLLGTILSERGAGRDQPIGGAITATVLGGALAVAVMVWLVRRLARVVDDRRSSVMS